MLSFYFSDIFINRNCFGLGRCAASFSFRIERKRLLVFIVCSQIIVDSDSD